MRGRQRETEKGTTGIDHVRAAKREEEELPVPGPHSLNSKCKAHTPAHEEGDTVQDYEFKMKKKTTSMREKGPNGKGMSCVCVCI